MLKNTDESIGYNKEGHKIYMVEGFDHPQVLDYGFRFVKTTHGIKLQRQHTGEPRGEATQTIWTDVPVVNEIGALLGYEIGVS